LGHQQAQVYMVLTMLTKSRWSASGSSGKAQEDLASRPSRTRWHMSAGDAQECATRDWLGGRAEKTIGGPVSMFRPQNSGFGLVIEP
jgi:hypothetical protein